MVNSLIEATSHHPFALKAFDFQSPAFHAKESDAQGKGAAVQGLEFKLLSATGAMMDTMESTGFRLLPSFTICVIISFVSIAVTFRAALIPFKLLFTVFLPMTWSYGA